MRDGDHGGERQARSSASRCSCDGTVDSSPIYLRGVRSRAGARRLLRHDDVRQDASRSTRRAARSSGASRRRATRRGPARRRSRPRRRSPTRAAVRSTRRRRTGGSTSSRSRRRDARLARHDHAPAGAREDRRRRSTTRAGHVIATTGGYIGDAPPYQGHVVAIDAASGRLLHVWNSLCTNRHGLIEPSTCPASDSAIWGRAGAVVDPAQRQAPRRHRQRARGTAARTGATRARPLAGRDEAARQLDADEHDRAERRATSTSARPSPVLLSAGSSCRAARTGRSGSSTLRAHARRRRPHKGGELQIVSTPSGTDLFTAPAVWRSGERTWLFAADIGGTAGVVAAQADSSHSVWRQRQRRHEPGRRRRAALRLRPGRRPRRLRAGDRASSSRRSRAAAATGTARSSPTAASRSPRATRTTTRRAACSTSGDVPYAASARRQLTSAESRGGGTCGACWPSAA